MKPLGIYPPMNNLFDVLTLKFYFMKTKCLQFIKKYLTLLFVFVGMTSIFAQVTDDTGEINPALTGRHLVHSTVTFVDGDENGIFDAVFTISEGPVEGWGDYVVGVVFYETGIRVKDGITGQHSYTNQLIPVSGQSYDLWIAVDMDNATYSTWVQTEGMDEPLLIHANAGFNNTNSFELTTWSAIHNGEGQDDYLTVENFELTTNSDPSLASLSANIGEMSPEFDPYEDAYDLAVPFGTKSIEVNAVANGLGASVEIIDNLGNIVGSNGLVSFSGDGVDLEIQVTAIDGTSFTYLLSIFVDDGSSDPSLVNITANKGVFTSAFSSAINEYTLHVPVGTTSVVLTGVPNYPEATVSGDGAITLSGGSATANITSTSFDGSSNVQYVVNILEADGKNYAIELAGVDGKNSHIDISGLNLKTLPYTVEMWIQPDGAQTDNSGLFYNRSEQGHAGVQYSSGWQGSGRIRVMTNIHDDYGVTTDVIPTSGWHHVAAVVTEESRTLYIDGTMYTGASVNEVFDFSSGKLHIGWDSDLNTRAFKGAIDEVRVWSDSLSKETLMENRYAVLQGDETNLVGYWNFDLGSANQVYDWTGNGITATIKGGTIIESFPRANLNLASLTVEDRNLYPEFNPGTTEYYTVLEKGAENFTVAAESESSSSNVEGDGNISVAEEGGTVVITVSEGSYSRDYTITYVVETDLTLKHSYTFADGTARDVVGDAHGTIKGGHIESGAYISTNEGDYIDLPGDKIAINTYATFTVELYFVAGDGINADNNTIMAWFGNTNPDNNYGVDGLLFTHKSRAAISTANQSSPWGTEDGVNSIMLDDGMPHYMVATVTNDSLSFFVDGTFINSVHLRNANKIFNLSNAHAYLAKGGYANDVTWKGTILEYNIYSGVMDEQTVAQRSASYPIEDGSADASLLELMVDGELLEGFSPYSYEYTVVAEDENAEPFITAASTNGDASVAIEQVSGIPGVATVTVTSADGESEVVYTINFEISTSIGKVEEQTVSVYPTVSSNSFTIKNDGQTGRYTVYDLSGRIVLAKELNETEETFSLQRAGIYILHVDTKNGIKVFKVIKK